MKRKIPAVHCSETLAVLSGPEVSLLLSPHVLEEESRGQGVIQCHQALSPFQKIKFKTSQPGSVPRASVSPQNKIKKTKTKHGHALETPTGGAHAPLLGDRSRRVTSLPCDNVSTLPARATSWRACAVHPWVLSTVCQGYRLQFAMKPPRFNGVVVSVAKGEAARVLQDEIASLLNKRAIRAVPREEALQGLYYRYFLIPKKGCAYLRPILDLRVLNRHLRKYTFRMLTHKVLCQSIRPGDWFVTIDLKDAYFHIAIYPAHRKFLRFAFQGKAYEYQAIPFGLSLAPRVFSKCVEAALSPLRSRGIRIFSYIDDYLICARSREQAVRDSATVINHLRDLGFNINWAKSRVVPAQCTEYLGLNINSLSYRVTLSEGRLTSLTQCLSLFKMGKVVSFRLCLRLLGLMASVISVVHLGLLMMRDFQRWVAALHSAAG